MKQINRFLTLLAALCLLTVLVPAASAAGSYVIETFEPETGEITVRAGADCTLAVAMYSAEGQQLWVDSR